MGCFCLGAPPQSPNLETVKRNGRAAVVGAGLKAEIELEGELEEALIGTAVEEPAVAAVNEPSSVRSAEADSQQTQAAATGEINAAAEVGVAGLQAEGSGGSAAALLGATGGEAATAAAGGPTDAQEDPADGGAATQGPGSATADVSPLAAGDVGGAQAAAEVQLEAGRACSSSVQEHGSPAEESSQATLLPEGPEVSLKQPRMSRLSSLLCASSRVGGEDGERHSRQEVGGGCLLH
jgi:hypothetical protein